MAVGGRVRFPGDEGIRVHIREVDHCCGNIPHPPEQNPVLRVSVCHCTATAGVTRFLAAKEQASTCRHP